MKTIKYLLSALIFMAGTSCDSEVSQRDSPSEEANTNEPAPLVTMVRIPAGKFIMGDINGIGDDDEKPPHEVYVSTFFISNLETTFELWTEVREWGLSNAYEDVGLGYGGEASHDKAIKWRLSNAAYQDVGRGAGKSADHPVHSISWYDIVKWCNARSEKEGLKPCYRVDGSIFRTGEESEVVCDFEANGYRLPTEAEWEKAARGGLESKAFPWGDKISHAEANFRNDADESYAYGSKGFHPDWAIGEKTYSSPVGSFPANGYGLYDMAGNMWEWCWDRYGEDYYGSSSASDPRGLISGRYRVRRGGSWFNGASYCRAASRDNGSPTHRSRLPGFRLTRSSVSSNSKHPGVSATDQTETFTNGIGIEMIAVKPGQVNNERTNAIKETEFRSITIANTYYLAQTEVTQAQWRAVMGTDPRHVKEDNLPVENVSWDDAMDFCKRLTQRESQADKLPEGYAYTLPTVYQWEYACRAGTTGDYAGQLDTMAWYDKNSGGRTHPVGAKRANAWGFHDMHGNVTEWCMDAGTLAGDSEYREIRGGSWSGPAVFCRSGVRFWNSPYARTHSLGFRPALVPSK